MGGSGRRRAAAALVAAVLLAGCSDDADESAAAAAQERLESDCAAAVATLLTTAQDYLDSIASTTTASTDAPPGPTAAPDAAAQEERFTRALSDIRAYAGDLGCDPARFRSDLAAGLERLSAGGPVANAVLLQLQADAGAVSRSATVPPGGDVAAAVAAAPPDGVVQLEAGEYELPQTLTLLRGVTLRGAGRDLTTLRSAAPQGVVLALTGDPVTLEGLTVARAGDAPGSVVTAAPAATLTIRDARVSGGRADADGNGGIGVLMAAGAAGQTGPARRTSLTITGTEVLDNAVAGVVVSGEHRGEIAGSVVERSGQCGVCFLGTSDGAVRDSRFAGSAAGVVTAGDARPLVTGSTAEGGDVGVQALERSAPQVEGVTARGNARAGFLFADSSTGSIRGSSCQDVPFGIVVGPAAAPTVEDNDCELARGQ